MRALLLALLLSPALARAESRPTFHETDPDVTMALSRLAPLEFQPMALMVLDTALPMAIGVLGAWMGCAGGAALFVASGRTPMAISRWPVRDTFLTYTSVGALAGGTLSMFAADVVLNARHLDRVFPARLAWTALMVPAPFLLAVGTLTLGYRGLPSWLSVASVYTTRGTWLFSAGCLPPIALALAAWTRNRTDDRRGSALWEEDPAPVTPSPPG